MYFQLGIVTANQKTLHSHRCKGYRCFHFLAACLMVDAAELHSVHIGSSLTGFTGLPKTLNLPEAVITEKLCLKPRQVFIKLLILHNSNRKGRKTTLTRQQDPGAWTVKYLSLDNQQRASNLIKKAHQITLPHARGLSV